MGFHADADSSTGAVAYPVNGAAANPTTHDVSGSDTDTVSSIGELDYNAHELHHMTDAQLDEHLFWQYQHAKSRWRKHMRKPTRKVRRFVKRTGKGKGGKGKSK